MMDFENVRENLRTILMVSAVFLAILAIFQLNGWSLEEKNQPPKEVVQVVELDAFTNGDGPLEKEVASMGLGPATSFCSTYNGAELETKCNALTRQGCSKVSCCGYLNGSKCVAGSKSGPTFLTDAGGNKIVVQEWNS